MKNQYFVILCCLLRRFKASKHFIFSSYCLAAVPARQLLRASKGMLAKKLVTLASTILLLQWMEILPTQGICKEAPLATRLHTNNSCPFCHTDFINQEEVIEHMEICSGTDPEPEVLKLICPYCQQTFDIYDKIENHIGIHIMRYIRNLHNLSQQLQQQGRVKWSHEHFSMNRF